MGVSGVVGRVRVVAVASMAAVVGAVAMASLGGASLGGASSGSPSVVVPLDPVRILDTRSGVGAPAGPLGPGDEITLSVGGVAGVPANATAVVVNLTATQAASPGYVSAFPDGSAAPDASVINYTPGVDVANMVTATLGDGGRLRLLSGDGTVHLLADVAGYLLPGGSTVGQPGPQGPQGEPGPAGPGATLVDVEVPVGAQQTVVSLDGVSVFVRCQQGSPSSEFGFRASPVANTLRYSLVRGSEAGPRSMTSGQGNSATSTSNSENQHVSGLVGNTALDTSYQVELYLRNDTPCAVWGSVIPLD